MTWLGILLTCLFIVLLVAGFVLQARIQRKAWKNRRWFEPSALLIVARMPELYIFVAMVIVAMLLAGVLKAMTDGKF